MSSLTLATFNTSRFNAYADFTGIKVIVEWRKHIGQTAAPGYVAFLKYDDEQYARNPFISGHDEDKTISAALREYRRLRDAFKAACGSAQRPISPDAPALPEPPKPRPILRRGPWS